MADNKEKAKGLIYRESISFLESSVFQTSDADKLVKYLENRRGITQKPLRIFGESAKKNDCIRSFPIELVPLKDVENANPSEATTSKNSPKKRSGILLSSSSSEKRKNSVVKVFLKRLSLTGNNSRFSLLKGLESTASNFSDFQPVQASTPCSVKAPNIPSLNIIPEGNAEKDMALKSVHKNTEVRNSLQKDKNPSEIENEIIVADEIDIKDEQIDENNEGQNNNEEINQLLNVQHKSDSLKSNISADGDRMKTRQQDQNQGVYHPLNVEHRSDSQQNITQDQNQGVDQPLNVEHRSDSQQSPKTKSPRENTTQNDEQPANEIQHSIISQKSKANLSKSYHVELNENREKHKSLHGENGNRSYSKIENGLSKHERNTILSKSTEHFQKKMKENTIVVIPNIQIFNRNPIEKNTETHSAMQFNKTSPEASVKSTKNKSNYEIENVYNKSRIDNRLSTSLNAADGTKSRLSQPMDLRLRRSKTMRRSTVQNVNHPVITPTDEIVQSLQKEKADAHRSVKEITAVNGEQSIQRIESKNQQPVINSQRIIISSPSSSSSSSSSTLGDFNQHLTEWYPGNRNEVICDIPENAVSTWIDTIKSAAGSSKVPGRQRNKRISKTDTLKENYLDISQRVNKNCFTNLSSSRRKLYSKGHSEDDIYTEDEIENNAHFSHRQSQLNSHSRPTNDARITSNFLRNSYIKKNLKNSLSTNTITEFINLENNQNQGNKDESEIFKKPIQPPPIKLTKRKTRSKREKENERKIQRLDSIDSSPVANSISDNSPFRSQTEEINVFPESTFDKSKNKFHSRREYDKTIVTPSTARSDDGYKSLSVDIPVEPEIIIEENSKTTKSGRPEKSLKLSSIPEDLQKNNENEERLQLNQRSSSSLAPSTHNENINIKANVQKNKRGRKNVIDDTKTTEKSSHNLRNQIETAEEEQNTVSGLRRSTRQRQSPKVFWSNRYQQMSATEYLRMNVGDIYKKGIQKEAKKVKNKNQDLNHKANGNKLKENEKSEIVGKSKVTQKKIKENKKSFKKDKKQNKQQQHQQQEQQQQQQQKQTEQKEQEDQITTINPSKENNQITINPQQSGINLLHNESIIANNLFDRLKESYSQKYPKTRKESLRQINNGNKKKYMKVSKESSSNENINAQIEVNVNIPVTSTSNDVGTTGENQNINNLHFADANGSPATNEDNNNKQDVLLSWLKDFLAKNQISRNTAVPQIIECDNIRIATTEHLSYIEKNGVEYAYYPGHDQNYGYMKFHPNSKKPKAKTRTFELKFLVLFGAVQFIVENKNYLVNGGDFLTIVKGTQYIIFNHTTEDALLLYIKC